MLALILISAVGILIMIGDIFKLKKHSFLVAILGISAAFVGTAMEWGTEQDYFNQMMHSNNFTDAFILLLLLLTFIWVISSRESLRNTGHEIEIYSLVFFALAGGIIMVSFSNMVMLFLGIEIISVAMYILAGSNKKDLESNEAALKYFLTGAFSTGFLLFGITLLYGATGSFNIEKINSVLRESQASNALLIPGILLILSSMSFKIAAFPLHFWAPDVYQGSPRHITAFMATIVKTSAIAAFFILFHSAFGSQIDRWVETLSVIAALSILVGNITAIFQNNFKRMLAYSGIAHAGYMLLAVIASDETASASLFYYTLAYSIATLGAFAVAIFTMADGKGPLISDFRGLLQKNPLAAITMMVCMLSLAGIPPLAGFFAKYYLFTSAIQSDHLYLVLFAIAGTLVSIYFYFRIIHEMILHAPENSHAIATTPTKNMVLILVVALLLLLGLAPDLILTQLSF